MIDRTDRTDRTTTDRTDRIVGIDRSRTHRKNMID